MGLSQAKGPTLQIRAITPGSGILSEMLRRAGICLVEGRLSSNGFGSHCKHRGCGQKRARSPHAAIAGLYVPLSPHALQLFWKPLESPNHPTFLQLLPSQSASISASPARSPCLSRQSKLHPSNLEPQLPGYEWNLSCWVFLRTIQAERGRELKSLLPSVL